jgi:hypothetical protein
VYAMDPQRRVWTLRATHDDEGTARRVADGLYKSGLRTRIKPVETKPVKPVAEPVYNPTREWRERRLQELMDLADARKRYKSPG